MDTEAVEFMFFLKRNVSELKRLGSEWGMTTDEINACIDKALENEADFPRENENRITAMEIWLRFSQGVKVMFKVILITFTVLFCVFMLASYHEATGNYVMKVLQPYGYDVFRAIRLATLPLHKMVNITSYYDAECLLDNPFFREPTQECDLCMDTHEVKLMTESKHWLVKRHCQQQQPFVFKPKLVPTVTFEDVVDLYNKNKGVLDTSVARFYSTDQEVPDIGSLFGLKDNDNLKKKTGLSVHWVSKNMASSQILRKMFPRPEFVPPESEVALEKTLYIDGPKSQLFEVIGGFYQAVFVTIVKGNRKAVFSSVQECSDVCSPLHVDLKEGDIVVFGPAMWRLNIMPNMEDTSIVYVGSFTV
ncbi:Hypothetical predicted protein [Mytilus galloprovincialis]|uniref:Uncharacterized protein n=1 Tax=Mytilus galloprovincialis TaxID=29158 RepID=A0A8B6FVF6_MYTGA|nr:Hypothetical predicted protein [Mytilus galloprovincialis]